MPRFGRSVLSTDTYLAITTTQDPFIEDPISGGEDELLDDVLRQTGAQPPFPVHARMLPRCVVALARWSIPF